MHKTIGVLLLALAGLAQDKPKPKPMSPDPDGPRPIAARETLFIEDLTWMEVRDAMKAGKDTVIIATGGDRKSTRLNSSHIQKSRMPSSA